MKKMILIIGYIILCGAVSAEIPLHTKGSHESDIPVACDAFYTQNPDYQCVYNMSSGMGSEIAGNH